jgi:hypothetical protein
MKTKQRSEQRSEQEPVGIVISGGPIRETPPVFSAYVWAPAPDSAPTAPEPRLF